MSNGFKKSTSTDESSVYKLCRLDELQPDGNWRIHVQCMQINAIREWVNERGSGQVASVIVRDLLPSNLQVRLVMFNEACDAFYHMFVKGQTYSIRKAHLKQVMNSTNNNTYHDYEIHLTRRSIVCPLVEEEISKPEQLQQQVAEQKAIVFEEFQSSNNNTSTDEQEKTNKKRARASHIVVIDDEDDEIREPPTKKSRLIKQEEHEEDLYALIDGVATHSKMETAMIVDDTAAPSEQVALTPAAVTIEQQLSSSPASGSKPKIRLSDLFKK